MYDVIVVGARCAGSPVAMLLARQGHRVLVLDRSTFPSDTVSTHYMHQTGLARLQAWGLLDRVLASDVTPIRELNFAYTGIEMSGKPYPVDGIDVVYCPRRTVLDQVLVDGAREAGAEVIEGFSVTEVVFDGDRAVGVRGRVGEGQEQEFLAAFVVGADGRNSVVADKVGAEIYRRVPAACFIYYSYFSGVDWGMHHRTAFTEQQIGTWPTNDGLQLLAVMRKSDRFADFRQDVEGNFQAVYDQVAPELGEQLRDSGKRVENFRPMRYPDNYYRRSHGPGWALVGDAGYHKDPITGWGISDAFKHGELLAEQLHLGLSGERPIDDAVADYTKLRDADSAGTFELTCVLGELHLTPYYDAVLRATSMSPTYSNKFLGLIAGGVPGAEFFAPANLAALYEEVDYPADKRILTRP
jgi:flavin-dependent dehydrogenase